MHLACAAAMRPRKSPLNLGVLMWLAVIGLAVLVWLG
jgi:hypothetical protein